MAVNRKTDSEINSGEVNDVNEVMIEKMIEKVTEMMDKKWNEMMDKKLNEMQKKLTVLKKPGNFKLTTAEVIHIVAFVKM